MSAVSLFPHQQDAVDKLHSGSILSAGVGSGKSITSLAYYYVKECGGSIGGGTKLSPPKTPKDLYIITTARKRDSNEWEAECSRFNLSGAKVIIDSWNNIPKYEKGIQDAFFIFDEQRVVGSGAWVKSFLKISKKNHWLLLSATPGDTWLDYVPVFVANNFYKNRTEFMQRHAVFNRFTKYPKVDKFIECGYLESLRRKITVTMDYKKPTTSHSKALLAQYDEEALKKVIVDRWNEAESRPIRDISEACYLMRKVVNSDPSRLELIRGLMKEFPRLIIFYTFNFELDILRTLSEDRECAEWNGHRHDPIPETKEWVYLAQYTSSAEGWNCVETNAVVFYSQNYSYKIMTQAAGRIDRMNTPYSDLYYYTIMSLSSIDKSIAKAIRNKQNFNELEFGESVCDPF